MSQALSADLKNRLQWSLLSLRVGVFIVLGMWVLDKMVNPGHTAAVLNAFYGIGDASTTVVTIMGVLQLVLVLAFLAGIKKRLTYGLVFVMHAISTFATFGKYIDGLNNLLFFAAWPMLAACLALYLLRDEDVKFTVK